MSGPSAPLRAVTSGQLAVGNGGLLGPRRYEIRWWDLTLECGHKAERPARYESGASDGRRGFARMNHPPSIDKVLPAPKRVRCDRCATATATDQPAKESQ